MSESQRVSIEAAVACMGMRRGARVYDVELTDQLRGALDGGKVFRIDAPMQHGASETTAASVAVAASTAAVDPAAGGTDDGAPVDDPEDVDDGDPDE